LFVELKFYALVSIVFVIGRIHQAQAFIILWLVASVALQLHAIDKLRYLLITDYSAFFIAGAAYFLIWSKGLSLTRTVIVAISWGLAVFQSMKGLKEFETQYNTSMNSYVIAGVVTTFFAVMMLVSLRRTGWVGRSRWLLVGVLTYPLYLLHHNIGFMVFNRAYLKVNTHLLFWGTIIVALISAYIVHICVERPFSSPMKAALNKLADRIQRLTLRCSAGADADR